MRWGEVAKVVQWEERHMGRTAVGGGERQYEDYLSLVLDSSSAARIYTYHEMNDSGELSTLICLFVYLYRLQMNYQRK